MMWSRIDCFHNLHVFHVFLVTWLAFRCNSIAHWAANHHYSVTSRLNCCYSFQICKFMFYLAIQSAFTICRYCNTIMFGSGRSRGEMRGMHHPPVEDRYGVRCYMKCWATLFCMLVTFFCGQQGKTICCYPNSSAYVMDDGTYTKHCTSEGWECCCSWQWCSMMPACAMCLYTARQL